MKTNNATELFAVDNVVIHDDMRYSQLINASIMMVDDEPIVDEIPAD